MQTIYTSSTKINKSQLLLQQSMQELEKKQQLYLYHNNELKTKHFQTVSTNPMFFMYVLQR